MKSGLKRTDASAPTLSSSSAPGSKGVNAGIDGSSNFFGETNGASNGKFTPE